MQIRLGSVIPHGVGGPEAIFIDFVYCQMLIEAGLNVYSYIGINQIADDLQELVIKEPTNKIYINIRYPVFSDFETRSEMEKNRIRVDIVHTALLRIADYDKRLDKAKLETIRNTILERNFSFEFVCETYPNKKNNHLNVKVVVHPGMTEFNYYAVVTELGKEKCRVPIYRGLPGVTYFYSYFFATGKWKNNNEFILTGNLNEVETRVHVDTCHVAIVNLTTYGKPPQYTLLQAGIPEEQRKISRSEYNQTLSPGSQELLRKAAQAWGGDKK